MSCSAHAQMMLVHRFLCNVNDIRALIGPSGRWSKSPIPKSPFAKRLTLKRALFIGNQLGLVFVYTSVESDKKSFGLVLSDVIYH